MYSIFPIPAFNDNYIWAICNAETGAVIIVDPGDAKPVEEFLVQRRYSLVGILLTHHHMDHIGGVKTLLKQYDIPVYGFKDSKIPYISNRVVQNEIFSLMGLDISVIEVPGHTLDHIAYFIEDGLDSPALFCGDTLFSAGCGRLFEGTPEQMLASLKKLSNLPRETAVYCTHEYTLANLAFAKSVLPGNKDLIKYSEKCERLIGSDSPTLPSSLKIEAAINPFLLCASKEVQQSVEEHSGNQCLDELSVFTQLRKWKDNF